MSTDVRGVRIQLRPPDTGWESWVRRAAGGRGLQALLLFGEAAHECKLGKGRTRAPWVVVSSHSTQSSTQHSKHPHPKQHCKRVPPAHST